MRARMLVTVAGLVGLFIAAIGVSPAGAGPSGSDKTFCKAVVKISLFFNTIEEEPSEKQLARIEELLEPVEENAPADIAEAVDTAVAGVRAGDLESPEVGEAGTTIDQWVIDNCGYEVVQVTARDYEFEGIPETLKTGTVLFEFTNEGTELHEIGVARIKGDESVEEILDLPEDEAEGKIQEVGAGFAAPGETTVAYLKLKKPGTYGAACFIPVGSTSFEAAETADGPPHFTEGMFAQFEVTKK